MRKIILALVATLGLLFGPAVAAQAGPATEPVFTLQGDIAYADSVASLWSKATSVEVVVAPCSGPGCIQADFVEAACGGAPGCAYFLADGTCQVEISEYVLGYSITTFRNTLAHEVGHCIIGNLQRGSLAWHAGIERDLMYAQLDPYDRLKRPGTQTRWIIDYLIERQ